jgi:zinc and cadmium transporter
VKGPLAFALYFVGILLAAMLGGSIPLWSRNSVRRIEIFLAGSAGVVLGVLGAHLLPEAFQAGPRAAWAIIGGFIFMLVVERFLLPHAMHAPSDGEHHEHCDPAEEKQHVHADTAGVGTFIGLSLHTIADGLALGAASETPHVAPYVFLAIVAHKVPSAFALGTILVRAQTSTIRVLAATAGLGSMVGFGGLLYFVAQAIGRFEPGGFTPYAVGFSAGSFLHVALTDLLPDLHPRGAQRRDILLALVGGLLFMIALSFLFPE